jgi:stage V sporulation protein G
MANKEVKTEKAFECLSVTAVQVVPLSGKVGNMLGLASVILNDQLKLSGLRIMDSDSGMLVCYPLNPLRKGEDLHSSVFPITSELREHIKNCVLEKYKHEQENANGKFDVELTHRNLSGASLKMEIIASSEPEAESKAKEKATELIPSTKNNEDWTILKVSKHKSAG